ncbi:MULTISPECIES: NAD(P)-dependent oxidoreductase [Streptomyces]|uniref:NAD(P)H-binding protein n=3 Tax=Streptomyces TaxID=1883 RepID=A0A7Y6KJX8_9ACTN|nr:MULTISPECIES: NAD(P)-binding oxidoreductase [Streptomyces]NUV49345.1 NAD(P)H-binding protein [Streptomyces sp. CAI-78]MCG5117605.1 SDR family oxidoreductase [Streptomyces sp. T7(2022)]MCR0987240.1 SDR family oxidoreductase [Streptomyces albidoflavus]NUV31885.1 NAD(P)H-binding protein [Streptomyces odorifer]QDD61553.1 epimerase [Streptomyces albidoflavus]
MNLTVFGATGRTGCALLTAAAAAGLPTTAHVRDPARLAGAPAGRVVTGSVFERDTVLDALGGATAVVVAFGLRRRERRVPLYAQGTRNVVDAMHLLGVHRLLVVSEAAYGDHVHGAVQRGLAKLYGTVAAPAVRGRREQDAVVTASGLDWTVVRPVALTEGPARGHRPPATAPRRADTYRLTYADLAELILQALPDPATYRRSLYP